MFGDAPLKANVRPAAYRLGEPMDWDTAAVEAGNLIAKSTRTAWVGLHPLTLESLRTVVTLAQQTAGCLLPRPHFDSPLRLTRPVTQLGTLGHLMSCDLILGIGVKRNQLPVKLQLAASAFEALPDTLQSIVELATAVHEDLLAGDDSSHTNTLPPHPFSKLLSRYKTVGVVLAPECDERVISQWHQLAAALQQKCRTAILELPHSETLNARGVQAVIAWRTACSIATGGVDFHTGKPRPCSQWSAMLSPPDSQHAADLIADLIIDTSLYPLQHKSEQTPDAPRLADVIRIASSPSPHAKYSFVVPDISPGMAGRVMRHDGLILRLAHQSQHALPDLTAALLANWLGIVSAARGQS